MSTKTVDISKLQAVRDYLLALIEPDTEIILTDGDKTLVKLVPVGQSEGTQNDRIPDLYPTLWVSHDFDDLLPGEYWLDKQS